MAKKYLTPRQLVDIYVIRRMGKKGDTWKEIGRRVGVNNAMQAHKKFVAHLEGKAKKRFKTYMEAEKLLVAEGHVHRSNGKLEPHGTIAVDDPSKVMVEDRYTRLSKAINTFMGEVEAYIDEEVKEIKSENEVMRSALEEAKIPNIVRNLKKKYENR